VTARRRVVEGCWYDFPRYYDVAMQDDTLEEAGFVEAVWKKFGRGRLSRILEPGCGSGRLVRELAGRGFQVVGFDDNSLALEYLRERLCEDGLKAEIFKADLEKFQVTKMVDLACSYCNTFRHLLEPEAALSHLRCVAKALRPGGLFLLGLHIMPIDVDPEDSETWICKRDGLTVKTTLDVERTFPRKRLERIRVTMDVDSLDERLRVRSSMMLRLWNMTEITALLQQVRSLELVETYDFLYDADDPITLDEYSSDVIFVLRKR